MNKHITARRMPLLEALLSGPKSWSYLRRIYFVGPRAESDSNTPFSNQLIRMQMVGLIKKTAEGEYAITSEAKKAMGYDCSHIVDTEGRCMLCMVKI